MRIPTVVAPQVKLDPSTHQRLSGLGLALVAADADETADSSLASAIGLADRHDALFYVADRGDDWRRSGPDLLTAATGAARTSCTPRSLICILLPALAPPQPGPVAVLSPAGSVSSYEVHLAAALATASGRRVEHLNGRGSSGSTNKGGIPARAAARSAVSDWRERATPTPERALHQISSRPAVLVCPVPPGSADASHIVAEHPDSDIFLLFDVAHARHGTYVAQQVASVVELALGLEVAQPAHANPADAEPSTGPVETKTERAANSAAPVTGEDAELPSVRASDVVHARLTGTAVEVTNRTRQQIRIRVGLGAAAVPTTVLAVFEAVLGPDESIAELTGSIAALEGLTSPQAVLRHWSHGSAEVYEGGDQRILQVEIAVLDRDGEVRAQRIYDAPNGLDFSVTARILSGLVGNSIGAPVLPEPAPVRARTASTTNWLLALDSAPVRRPTSSIVSTYRQA